MKWIVGGVNKVRSELVPIRDTVQGASTTTDAMKKARRKYPRAPELSVKEPSR